MGDDSPARRDDDNVPPTRASDYEPVRDGTVLSLCVLALVVAWLFAADGSPVLAAAVAAGAIVVAAVDVARIRRRPDERSLRVRSESDESLRVRIAVTPADGDDPVVEADRRIPPGAEVDLDGPFVPGERYVATVAVQGGVTTRTELVPVVDRADEDAFLALTPAGVRVRRSRAGMASEPGAGGDSKRDEREPNEGNESRATERSR